MKKKSLFVLLFFFLIVWPVISYGQIINMRHVRQSWKTDTTKHLVPLNEFRALLQRDAIRPIDTPYFVPLKKTVDHYFENEPICVVSVGNETRGYPLSILLFHEIVNDRINNRPVSVTYCPLCNSVRVFDRRVTVDGKSVLLDFGTTGMLRKSNLVMWDRQTETWWQQFTGKGMAGNYAGVLLSVIPSMTLSFHDYITCFPKGKILLMNKKKGFPYGMNPYRRYDSIGRKPRLYFGIIDSRLPAMERVVHIHTGVMDKIYPYSLLETNPVINDEVGTTEVALFYRKEMQSILDERDIRQGRKIGNAVVFIPEIDGQRLTFLLKKGKIRDKETGSVWCISGKCVSGKLQGKQLKVYPYSIDFAFALFGFYPGAEIYGR